MHENINAINVTVTFEEVTLTLYRGVKNVSKAMASSRSTFFRMGESALNLSCDCECVAPHRHKKLA